MSGGIRRCQRLPDVTYPVIRRDSTSVTSNRVPVPWVSKQAWNCWFAPRRPARSTPT